MFGGIEPCGSGITPCCIIGFWPDIESWGYGPLPAARMWSPSGRVERSSGTMRGASGITPPVSGRASDAGERPLFARWSSSGAMRVESPSSARDANSPGLNGRFFFGNNAGMDGAGTSGYESSQLGYLNIHQFAYAHSLFALARNEEEPTWARHLRPDVRKGFHQGLKYLRKTGDLEPDFFRAAGL